MPPDEAAYPYSSLSLPVKNSSKPTGPSAAQQAQALKVAIERARAGDKSVLTELRTLLVELPDTKNGGDLSQSVIDGMLDAQFDDDLVARELVLLKLAELRSSLSGPKPTPVESLLIERIVCCWLRLNLSELATGFSDVTDHSLTSSASRSLDRYHKQYLSALKALADLRKLNVTIMLNVARRNALVRKSEPICL